MAIIQCEILSIQNISQYVVRVKLKPQRSVDYQAGQYLMLLTEDNKKIPFSIASSPLIDDTLELHIGVFSEDLSSSPAIKWILENASIAVEIPLGEACYQEESQRPLLLIAGGTGFSYVKSILHTALLHDSKREILLYWGSKNEAYFYALDELAVLARNKQHFHYQLVVDSSVSNHWSGKQGTVIQAILDDQLNLSHYDIYIAGPIEMVKAARTALCQSCFADNQRMFSDAFAFI